MNFWSEIENVTTKDSEVLNENIEDYSERSIEGDNIAPSSDKFLFAKNKIKKGKVLAFFIFTSFILFVLISRVYQLQIIKNSYYSELSDGNKTRNIEIKPQRGIIFDKNFKKLVNNIPIYYLYYIPYDVPKKEDELNKLKYELKLILNLDDKILNKIKFARSYKKVFLVEVDDLDKISKVKLDIENTSGLLIEPYFIREYENSDVQSLSSIIGYVGKLNDSDISKYPNYKLNDNVGKYGLELYYEDKLKGSSGAEQIEVNNVGKEIKVTNEIAQQPGNNLKLSIDYNFQKKIEEILQTTLTKNHLKSGTVIAMNPKNGAILGLVSLPSYNSNDFSFKNSDKINEYFTSEDKPLFNRAIGGKYPPASTFKLIMASAGLEDGVINTNTIINDLGKIVVKNKYGLNVSYTFKGWDPYGLGKMNIYHALAQSSDIYFYYVGGGFGDFRGLGIDKMVEYFKKFKLDQKTGIDLPYEVPGFIPTPEWKNNTRDEIWTLGNTYNTSIGQGDLLLTPMQIAMYTSYFANNGTSYEPRVVDSILDENNNLVSKVQGNVYLSNIVSQNTTKIIRDSMKLCVDDAKNGTCRGLRSLNIDAAGKTGTAEVANKTQLNAVFTGFAPFDNPEIVVTVLVENGGEGSTVALPIARDVLKEYFKK